MDDKKPTLHLLKLAGLSREEQVKAIIKLWENLTGKTATPEDVARVDKKLVHQI